MLIDFENCGIIDFTSFTGFCFNGFKYFSYFYLFFILKIIRIRCILEYWICKRVKPY